MWHERAFWNPDDATFSAHHSQNHVFVFGKHLVGDWATGSIYHMDISTYDDDTHVIRRLRRAPHISTEQDWIFYRQLQIDLEVGLGLPDPNIPADYDPQVMLRWSNDGAKTWGNEFLMSAGKMGEYKTRVIQRRMGRARDRVFEISTTARIPWRLVDAYLKADPGYAVPTERLAKQLGKGA
jgi:hypothetical protein